VDGKGTNQNRTVEQAGMIRLFAGETARIEGILAGTRFIVEEIGAAEAGYSVLYEVDHGNVTDGYASGEVPLDASVQVLVTNTERGISIRIPVRKTMTVDDGTDHAFSVRLMQIENPASDAVVQGGTDQTVSVSVQSPAEFLLTYVEPTIGDVPQKLYYRIFEEDASECYRCDPSVYVVEITVDRDANDELHAVMTGLWKDGISCDPNDEIEFQNTRLTQLAVSKTVTGASVGTDAAFSMMLQLTVNGQPWQQTCLVETEDGTQRMAFDEEGTLRFSLRADEKICLSELPYGADWELTELDTDGFHVSMQINDSESQSGNSIGGTLPLDPTVVSVTNVSDYALPSAGGIGTKGIRLCGTVLCLIAVCIGAAHRIARKRKTRT